MKKSLTMSMVVMVMLFAVAGFASAASLSLPGAVYVGLSGTGDGAQERNITTTANNFEIRNNGNTTIESLAVTTTADPRFNVSFSLDASTGFASTINMGSLGVNETKKIYIKGIIPQSQASGTSMDIGDVTFTGTNFTQSIESLLINPMSKIKIKSVKVIYSGDEQGISEGNTEKLDYDGTRDLEVQFDVKNLFGTGDDNDIEDIDFYITLEDIDDEDIEDDFDDSNLNSGKSETKTRTLRLPSEIDSNTHKLTIEASGVDQFDAVQSYIWHGFVEFQREEHMIKITSASLNPSVLKCTKSTTITVSVMNIGDTYENHAAITVNSSTLGVSAGQAFELDYEAGNSASKTTKTFPITIADVKPGTYTIGVSTSAEGSEWVGRDYQGLELTVQDCNAPAEEEPEDDTSDEEETETPADDAAAGTQTNGNANYVPPGTGGQVFAQPLESNGSDFTESTAFIVLLVLAILVVMVIVVALLLKLIK